MNQQTKMKENTPKEIAFKIEGIELLEYSLNSPLTALPDKLEYKFDLGIEQKISLPAKRVFVVCSITVSCDHNPDRLAHAKISCIYEVPELESFLDKSSNDLILPDNLAITLISVSLSTCRGVMFTLFRGTFLHNAVLPLVDPQTFIKNGN